MPTRLLLASVASAAVLAAAACDSTPQNTAASNDVTWDTLPSGAVHAVYSSFPIFPLTTTADLRIGGASAEGPAAFGDVRAIDVDRTGKILVLDGQAMELRAFDANGAPAGVVMKKGEGPSEIEGANGFRVDTLGAIWVNDHGRGWKVTRVKDGQFTTYPMPALQYGFVWNGGVTHGGRIRDFDYRPLDGSNRAGSPRPTGVLKSEARVLLKSLDPASGTVDSVSLGTQTSQYVSFPNGGMSIPFVATPLFALDPAGAVWTAMSDVDRLVKLSATGDTLLIVELPGTGPDATPAERTAEIEKRKQPLAQRGLADVVDWEAIVPKRKPVLVNLAVDDQSRLWVQRRTLSRGPVFDVLDANGQLLGSIDPDFEPAEYLPPVVRGKSLYAVVTDSLDVPTVVRAPVPLR